MLQWKSQEMVNAQICCVCGKKNPPITHSILALNVLNLLLAATCMNPDYLVKYFDTEIKIKTSHCSCNLIINLSLLEIRCFFFFANTCCLEQFSHLANHNYASLS